MVSSALNYLRGDLHTDDLVMLAVDAGSHGSRELFLGSFVSAYPQIFLGSANETLCRSSDDSISGLFWLYR